MHVEHGGGGVSGQRVPDLQAAQQFDRRRVQRIGAHIVGAGCARGLRPQRHRQAGTGQRQREAAPDDARTEHLHVEVFHRPGL